MVLARPDKFRNVAICRFGVHDSRKEEEDMSTKASSTKKDSKTSQGDQEKGLVGAVSAADAVASPLSNSNGGAPKSGNAKKTR